jgi:hypothetical protein
MNTGKNIFWKKFNLQIFLLIALCFFIATLMVECVWNLIAKDPVSPLFTLSALLHRTFEAIIASLIVYFLKYGLKEKTRISILS